MDPSAVGERGDEVDVRKRGRKDAAANGKDFSGDTNGFGEIAGDMGESGEEEIAEVVTAQTATGVETILEELGEEGFVLGESDHAVADIAGREHAVFPTQAARAAAVIGNGNDGGEIDDGTFGGRLLVAAANDMFLESTKKRGKAGAATESDDPDALDRIFVGARTFHE